MIVPQFWAEARLQRPRTKGNTQITVRRFGWSDTSQAEADAMAKRRAEEALQSLAGGSKSILRREPKTAYNGAQGVPIREEILSRHGNAIVTRNGYGAHCLNVPNVLFADIDLEENTGCLAASICAAVLLIISFATGAYFGSRRVGAVLALASLFLAFPFAGLTRRVVRRIRGGPERIARARINAFVRRHPDWTLRLYQTPAGFRLLAMHATFDASSPEVAAFFKELGVDAVYATMCRNQHCFRARVSPKPWRIGISHHIRPRPGLWPVNAAHLGVRQQWVRAYEAAAVSYASCRYIETLGGGRTHPAAEKIRELHDRLSQALSARDIA